MIYILHRILILTCIFSLMHANAYAQRKKKKTKQNTYLEQAKDDAAFLSKADFPYIENFHKAIRLNMAGNYKQAKEILMDCLKDKPNDDAVLYLLSQISKKENMHNQALDYLKQAYAADSTNRHYVYEIATAQLQAANFEESAKLFEKLLIKEPRNAELQYSYAQALVFSRRYKEAFLTLEKIQNLIGPTPEITFTKAELLEQSGEQTKIDEEFALLMNTYPDNEQIFDEVKKFYHKREQTNTFVSLLEKKVDNNSNAYLHLAAHYIVTKQKEKFNKVYNLLIEDDNAPAEVKASLIENAISEETIQNLESIRPTLEGIAHSQNLNYQTQAALGRIYLELGELKKGIDYSRAALHNNTQASYKNWIDLLNLEQENGVFVYLLEDAQEALSLYPTLPEIYAYAAIANMYTNNLERCFELLEEGEEYIVNDADGKISSKFKMVKAIAAYAEKNFAKGDKLFKELVGQTGYKDQYILEWCKQNAWANYDIANTLKRLNNVSPKTKEASNYKLINARLLFALKRYTEAQDIVEVLQKKLPNIGNVLDLHGDILYKLGNTEQANQQWNKASKALCNNKSLTKKIESKKLHEARYY